MLHSIYSPLIILPQTYNLASVLAFLSTGSNFVACTQLAFPSTELSIQNLTAITFPFIFSFPPINNFCAFALPCTSFPKSPSLNTNVTAAFFPSGATPLPTVPVSFKSMYHDSCSPALFLRVKAKIAPPVLMASARSEAEEERERDISSKAAEEGKAPGSVR
jgi:hypothetical protein